MLAVLTVCSLHGNIDYMCLVYLSVTISLCANNFILIRLYVAKLLVTLGKHYFITFNIYLKSGIDVNILGYKYS